MREEGKERSFLNTEFTKEILLYYSSNFFFNLKSKFWAASNVSFWDNEAHVAKWLTFKLHALKGKKFSYSKSSNVSSQYLLGPLYK